MLAPLFARVVSLLGCLELSAFVFVFLSLVCICLFARCVSSLCVACNVCNVGALCDVCKSVYLVSLL